MTLADLMSLLQPMGGGDVLLVTETTPADADIPPDALVYVYAPPRARAVLLRRLRAQGLRGAAAFLHVRGSEADEMLVQLDRAALGYATGTLLSTAGWIHVASASAPQSLLRAASLVLPRIGILCRRANASQAAASDGLAPGGLILRRTRRDGRDRRFVYAPSRRLFVKIDTGTQERASLEQHARLAESAGALVPHLVTLNVVAMSALAVTLLPGRPASAAIEDGSVTPDAAVASVAEWLLRWNRATAASAIVTDQLLEHEVLRHLAAIEEGLVAGRDYRAWLEERSRAWLGAELPLVTAHHDLTMANVLLPPGAIGVIDWAEARARSLPLVDLFYAAADAAAAVNAYRDRVGAFQDGTYERLVRHSQDRFSRTFGLTAELRELCFHACWLHHAHNESKSPSAEMPFRGIVDAIAAKVTAG